MIKKAFIFLLLCTFACNNKEVKETETVASAKAEDTVKTTEPEVGADEDLHGCKASAGYTWSVLKNDCVRIFEIGTPLQPYQDPTGAQMSAFVIFDGNKAEIFTQTEKPFIAERKSEGDRYVYGDWQLIPWKGYVLKKKDTILYTGK